MATTVGQPNKTATSTGQGAMAPAKPSSPSADTSVVMRIAQRYKVDERKLLETLKNTCFQTRNNQQITDAQMMALLVVADQYKLNPFTKELFAFPDKQNGIVPVVSVDGWARIINENPQLDGLEFNYSEDTVSIDEHHKACPAWCEVVIYRKDRSHPTRIKEYLDEVYRPPYMKDGRAIPGPWQTHTKRFLRHKTLIQGSRIAFGFSGIYDEDEAERIREANEHVVVTVPVGGATRAEQARAALGVPLPVAPPAAPLEPEGEQEVMTERQFAAEHEQTPASSQDETLDQHAIRVLRACKTRNDLRVVWDGLIEQYLEGNTEIPSNVEDEFNTRLDVLSRK